MPVFASIPEYREHEAPESFVSRLAASNCATSIDNLFKQLGGTIDHYNMLKAKCYEIVLDMAGVTAERYEPYFFRSAERYRLIRDQRFAPRSVCRSRARYCPVCVSTDVANGTGLVEVRTYQRFYWFVREIAHCPWHGCKMVETDYCGHRRFFADFAPFAKANMARIEREAANSVTAGNTPFERYLLDRLLNEPTSIEILDMCQPHVVTSFCEDVGRLRYDANALDPTRTKDLQKAFGFQIVCAGRQKFLEFLTARIDSLAKRKKYRGTRNDRYGYLYVRLQDHLDNPDWRPILEMIIEDALQNLPLGEGETFLDHTMERRRIHSAYTMSEQSGLHPSTVVKMLRRYGIIDRQIVNSQYHSITFDAVRADDLLRDLDNSISMSTVHKELGVTKTMVNVFSDAGVIRESAMNKAYTHQKHYRLDDYRRLLSNIEAIPVVDAPGDGFRPLLTAQKWAELSAADMFLKVLSGDFNAVRVRGQLGLASVHVFRLDVVGDRPSDRVSACDAREILGTSKMAIDALVTHGFLSGATGRNSRGPWSTRLFDRTELARFSERYITIYNVCRERRLNPQNVSRALSEAGIEPIFEVAEKSVPRFFLRADLDRFFENVEITSLFGKHRPSNLARKPMPS